MHKNDFYLLKEGNKDWFLAKKNKNTKTKEK